MVAAAPGITDEQKAAITADVEKMVEVRQPGRRRSPTKGWANTYLAGDDFADAARRRTSRRPAAILKDIGLVQ